VITGHLASSKGVGGDPTLIILVYYTARLTRLHCRLPEGFFRKPLNQIARRVSNAWIDAGRFIQSGALVI